MVMLDPWPTLTIEGRPASKKNSRKIVTPRGKSHSVLVNDARYQKWHRGAMTALYRFRFIGAKRPHFSNSSVTGPSL